MGLKTRSKVIIITIFLLFVFFLNYISFESGEIENYSEDPCMYAIIFTGMLTIIMIIVPLIYYYSPVYKKDMVRDVCKWNSIIMFFISYFTKYWIGIIGVLIYYYINLILFDSENSYELIRNDINTSRNINEKTVNSNVVKSSKNVKSKSMDQKYSELKKIKDLLDKDIISKEEFDREKKKILK